ncbi:MAG: heparin lyase I family protein [Chitinophagaceae bacterium]|nr:heparin lyase I family protein [Chitinophagaceae bacterium]
MKNQLPYGKPLHVLLVFIFLVFSKAGIGQILLQSSFEGSNPFSGFTNNQSCCSYSVTASTAHPRDGSQSFRAEVRANDPAVSSGYRAELTTPNISDQGDMWYGWSMYFETPVGSNGNWTGGYGGHVVQWHPNNSSGSASLALWGSDGVWDVCINPSGSGSVTHQSQVYGGGSLRPIVGNTWHDVVFHVNWSTGLVEFWLNGTMYARYTGLTFNPSAYFKFGMNRWSMTNDWVVYYDNLKIGRNVTYNDVAPTPSGNIAPTANAGTDITLTLPANSTTLNGSGTDTDGSIASYAWTRVSGPTTFTLGTANAPTTTLSNLVQGTYVFRLTVTDNGGATSTDDVTVTVNAAANQTPTANAGTDITMTLPTNSTTLNGSGTDPDGTIASYAWARVSGPTTFTLGTANAATTTLTNLVQGTYVFRLTVTDNGGATATDNVTVTVNAAPNQSPTANAGTDITLTLPANSTTLNGSGTDPDGTISSYAWTRVSGPTTFTLGSANAAITTLTNLVQGTYVFRLTVTDNGGATATDNVTVTVNPAPQPPVANAGSDITLTLPVNSTTLTGSGSDPDGTISSYAWARVSGPTTFTSGTPNASTTALTNLVQGTYVFRLTVTDNSGLTGTDDVTVNVNAAPNQAPSANAGNNITLTLPANSTTLNGSGTDPDGTIAGYAWTRVSGPTTFTLGTANTATTSLSGLVQGTYVFRLTVTDNNGATGTDDVTVTVNAAPNQAPTANAGANIVITLPTNSTTLNGAATDPDGTISSYAWTRVSGPTTFTLGTANAATTTLTNLVQGTYVFRLTVTDNSGATATDDVNITVNAAAPTNQAPIANAGTNITISLPTNSTILNGNGSVDLDGTISTYAWSYVSGPATYTIVSANNVSTALTGLVQGTYIFRLTVTDNGGATDADNVVVTVNVAANQAPSANAGNNITLTLPVNSTTLNGSGADIDGTVTSYAWTRVSGPTTFTLGTPNAATTTLANLVEGTYVFRLTVTDNNGAAANDDVTVTVNPAIVPNQPPVSRAGNDVVMTLPVNSTTLNGNTSTDADGTIVSYSWSRISGPATYTFTSAGSAATGLNNLVQGTYVFRLTVTDDDGASATDDITVTVNAAPNQAPVADAGNDISITLPVNSTTLTGTGTDIDGTISSYAWTRVSGPATFTLGAATASTTTLSNLVQGTYVFRLTVTDNNGVTGTDDVTVIVNPAPTPNQPPVARAGNDIVMTLPTNSTTLNGNTSTDADGTIVSYSWSRISGPATYTLSSAGSVATGLTNLVQGIYVFRLTVTDDDGASSTDDITVTVNAAANQAPVANAGNDITITLPVNSTTLTGSGTDADGTITGYAWVRVSGPTTFTLGNAAAATTTLTGLVQGIYVFRLTVTDNSGSTGTDNVTVVVNAANPPANQAPVANAGTDITLTLPANSTTLNGSGSDQDGSIVAYNWVRVSGPATFLMTNGSAVSTPLSNLVQGVYVFRLTVTDNYGATASDNVTVTVNAAAPGANQAPTARISADSIVLTLPVNSVSLNGSGSTDADGIIAVYDWSQISGPNAAAIDNSLSATSQVSGLTIGTYIFQLKVTDDDGATGVKTVTVIVKNKSNDEYYFNLYPNPASTNLTLQYFANSNGKHRISVYDAARKLVKDGFADKTQVTLTETMDVSNLRNGIYIIQIVMPDGKTVAKQFVKM